MFRESSAPTDISLLRAVAEGSRDQKLIALGWFYERYRAALVTVLEQRLRLPGLGAEDLLHDFFFEKIWDANLIDKYLASLADPLQARRRFRDYLARSICNFAIDKLRTTKRFQELEDWDDLCAKIDVDIKGVINIGWFLDLLVHALRLTRQHYVEKGMQAHWDVFLLKWVSPAVLTSDDLPHEEISHELGLKDAKAASNMLVNCWHTLRRNWMTVLQQETSLSQGESLESVFQDISDSLSMSKYVDARRLLLQVVSSGSNVPSNTALRPEQVSSLLGLSMNSLAYLTKTEQNLVFASYLNAPVIELLGSISQGGPKERDRKSTWPAVSEAASILEVSKMQPPAIELIRGINRYLQLVIKGDSDAMPAEIAGVIRFYLLTSLDQTNRELVTTLTDEQLRQGVATVLKFGWIDQGTRVSLERFLSSFT